MRSPVTINQLIRLGYGQRPEWIQNPSGETVIEWVETVPANVQDGDLLLLEPESAKSRHLNDARANRAAAVLFLGSAPGAKVRLPSALPVAWVATDQTVREAHKLLLTIFINQRSAMMERGVRIHNQLSQIIAEGAGLEGLSIAIADLCGRGVVIQDKRLRILAQKPSPTLSNVWDEVLQPIQNREMLPEVLNDRKQAGRSAPTLQQELPGGIHRMITPIVVKEIARGYLSLVGLIEEADILDYLVLENGATVCAVEMAQVKAVRETEKRLKGNLLIALLEEDMNPRDALLWVQSMGLDPALPHAALRFSWDKPGAPSRRRLETIVNGEVARLGKRVIVNPLGNEIVCFCEIETGKDERRGITELADGVIAQGQEEYGEFPIRCGIGAAANEMSAWRISFRQAGQALEMARRLRSQNSLHFADLSVYRLLMQIEHSPELVAFQEELLGPLLAHEGSGELLNTLETYFEHNGNLSQAAEALFIHRNTLVYRMERISEIGGLNLDKPETRLAVQLALHIYRMRARDIS